MNEYEHDKARPTGVMPPMILMPNRASTLRRTCRFRETVAVQALCVFACGLLAAPRDGVNRQYFAPGDDKDDPVTLERNGLLAGSGDQGAKRPADKADHWAFKPARRPAQPNVKNSSWARNPVDRFVLAKLEAEGLAPSPEADRRTLIRRLSFDLTGLPPSPEEVGRFAADPNPRAYEELVDRLLASPRYGERWGRHWLDVVHYGESHGYDKDKLRPNSWPYRDYVIRSFNSDKPYSRFVAEQLAGDVLYPDEPDGVVATGFLAAGPWDFVGHVELPITKTDGLIARYNDRDDMVMTTMSTFQSLTVHCARCHDHKFDPITQRDYYSLQAVFAGVDRANRPYDADKAVFQTRRKLSREKESLEARQREIDAAIAKLSNEEAHSLDRRLREIGTGPIEPVRQGPEPEQQVAGLIDVATRSEINRITARLVEVNRSLAALPPPSLVYAAAHNFTPEGSFVPAGEPRPVHLLLRGDVKRPGRLMTPAGLEAVPGPDPKFELRDLNDEGARRAALAKWLTDRRNSLTRRSLVNRVWQYHFGRGIVDSPNDFGRMGSSTSHPELLDWLAGWFADDGESIKQLHRLLLTCSTYRQSSRNHPASARIDGDNRYLWRMNRTRLEAEEIRDTMLAVSGKLDLTMGGPSVRQFYFKDDHSPGYDYTRYDVDDPGSYRRCVYRHIIRSVSDPFLDCLDAADPSLLTPKRNTTLTALQALATLNNPFVLRQCEHFAGRLSASGPEAEKQVQAACELAWSRAPTEEETRSLAAYARSHGLANFCRLIFNSTEFMFID